jgi:hypothetical protein
MISKSSKSRTPKYKKQMTSNKINHTPNISCQNRFQLLSEDSQHQPDDLTEHEPVCLDVPMLSRSAEQLESVDQLNPIEQFKRAEKLEPVKQLEAVEQLEPAEETECELSGSWYPPMKFDSQHSPIANHGTWNPPARRGKRYNPEAVYW